MKYRWIQKEDELFHTPFGHSLWRTSYWRNKLKKFCISARSTGQVRRIWTNAARRVEGWDSKGEEAGTLTFLRERHLRHHGPLLVRSAAGDRGHLPRGEPMVTRWRSYKTKYDWTWRISRQTFRLKPRTIVVVTGMSRRHAVTVGEISGSIEGYRTVRISQFSFVSLLLLLLFLPMNLHRAYMFRSVTAPTPWRGIRTRCSARRFSARCSWSRVKTPCTRRTASGRGICFSRTSITTCLGTRVTRVYNVAGR